MRDDPELFEKEKTEWKELLKAVCLNKPEKGFFQAARYCRRDLPALRHSYIRNLSHWPHLVPFPGAPTAISVNQGKWSHGDKLSPAVSIKHTMGTEQ